MSPSGIGFGERAPRGAPELAINAAWPGARPKTTDGWHVLSGGLAFIEALPTPDGKYRIGFTMIPHDREADERKDVVLLDRESNAIRVLHHLPSPEHQMLYADADDHWISWIEASLQPNFEDWTLYAYDRQNGALKRVASAPIAANGQPPWTPNVQPKVDHGYVVWSAATAEEPAGEHVDSYIADLERGGVRTLAHEALGAGISWPVAVVARHAPSAALGTRLVSLDLETGAEGDLGIEGATYYAIVGEWLAWIDQSFHAITLRNLATGDDRTIVDYRTSGEAGPHLQFICMSPRLVTWGQGGAGPWASSAGAWAYDRKLNVRVKLTTAPDLSYVFLKGTALDWTDGRGPGGPRTETILRSLDDTDLP